MIAIRFVCNHTAKNVDAEQYGQREPQKFDPSRVTRPKCGLCGETRIAQVSAPKPRFLGVS